MRHDRRVAPTTRLYYDDSTLTAFDADVVAVRTMDGAIHVALDRSAFYPTSGGQPHDVGSLAPHGSTIVVSVSDVLAGDDGVVWHVVDRALDPGVRVSGTIDARRRFDLRQQHSGQHILSASFETTCGASTRSVHLGSELSTLDLDREVPAEALAEAERDANRVVFDDRPVSVRYADADEANALGLRKQTQRTGTVRVVEVQNHDLSACGGTHVTRTGEVGLIVVRSTERFKGGTRVTFLCGWRALEVFRAVRDALDSTARALGTSPDDVPTAVARLQEDGKAARKRQETFDVRLSELEANALAPQFERVGTMHLLVAHRDEPDPATLRRLAAQLVSADGRVVVLTAGPAPHALVVARSADLTNVDAGALARTVASAFGGKAGGRPDLAQGGGVACTTQGLRVSVRRALEQS
jgi:alanyl-tRNA synthetase